MVSSLTHFAPIPAGSALRSDSLDEVSSRSALRAPAPGPPLLVAAEAHRPCPVPPSRQRRACSAARQPCHSGPGGCDAPLRRRGAQCRGQRAQRASCSDSPRLSERSAAGREVSCDATPARAPQWSRTEAPTAAASPCQVPPGAMRRTRQKAAVRLCRQCAGSSGWPSLPDEKLDQRSFTPHQRAMNSASTCVTSIMLSIDTHSSMPCVLPDCGP